VLLALGGCAAGSDHREMLRAIAREMLDGAIPNTAQALDAVVHGVEVAIASLPPAVQGEIRQLFGLLEFPLTRRILAGVGPWNQASDADVANFLQRWRSSNAALLRSGYAALHQLVMAGWYGNEAAWPPTRYPGPPHIA
jgi:hypothetical protein